MNRWELARLEVEWSKLLDKEEEIFQRCCHLDNENPDKTPAKAQAVREWWSAANAVLSMFIPTRTKLNHELLPFPAHTLSRLAHIAEELSNGNVLPVVSDAAGGGHALFRMERHHIAHGVLYIEAVRRGEIDNPAPIKTVAQAYKVTKQTVRNWIKRRDKICVGVPHKNLTPEELTEEMFDCAVIYAWIGRGASSEK